MRTSKTFWPLLLCLLVSAGPPQKGEDTGPPFSFIFGPPSLPVSPGQTLATSRRYTPAFGFGWKPGTAVYEDRRWGAIPAPLTAGFVYGRDATFLVDLPDGAYDVTPTLGDALVARDQVAVYAQGKLVASGTNTPAGGAARPTFRVQVKGQLSVRFADLGGDDPYFAVTALDVIPAAIVPASVNSVAIDPAWLAIRGDGPYLLDQPGITYTLAADLRTKGTAFVVTAAHVTLDLGGHTVTYDDSPPPSVTNGSFESGTGREAPGWDTSGATAASLAANSNYLFGSQVLRLSNFTAPQRVVSLPVAVPEAGRLYAATVTPAAGNYASSLTLSVVDSVTGDVLANAVSRSVSRGISAVATFLPKTTNPVRLRIDVAPPDGQADSMDLDEATLAYAYDYGVVATQAPADEVLALPNLGQAAQKAYKGAADFTVRNGNVVQGAGRGYGATALFCKTIPGVTIDGVGLAVSGVDSLGVYADHATDHVTVKNSTVRHSTVNITDRLQDFAAVSLNGVSGPIEVSGNHVLGAPQIGIMVTDSDQKSPVLVKGNEVRHKAVVTNGYGIVIEAVSNFEVAGNTVITESGRGIDLDGYGAAPTQNGSVHDNTVSVQEGPNREEGTDGSARALRMRNNVDAMGPHRNVRVYNNTFSASTGPGLMRAAFGGRVDYMNPGGRMNDANIVIDGNTFKAVVTTPDENYQAQALDVDGVEPGINLVVSNNVLESNHISLTICGSDQGPVSGVTLNGNTIRKSAEGAARDYTEARVGYWVWGVQGVTLAGTKAEAGAKPLVTFSGTGPRGLTTDWPTVGP